LQEKNSRAKTFTVLDDCETHSMRLKNCVDAAQGRANKIAKNSANRQTGRANAECMVGVCPRVSETDISSRNLQT